MTQKAKPTIIDLLYMPDAAEIDIDFEKVEIKITKEDKHDELVKDLRQKDNPSSNQ